MIGIMDKAGDQMQRVKQYYEKMIDFKGYGIVTLCASIFFYLGLIIPSAAKSQIEITVMMAGSIVFLFGSIFFFSSSTTYRKKLLETEEGQEYLFKKENIS
ncbi:YrhC family protein [Bacillus benzoevorans]|uniref:YrhC-like protein n=1 Tax=Bacillus benzoevorans TaxID=1456 RepID=A0A7X0HSC3_9BACI|nr:YrhC family protein [Bacillus benzoevorans]MBB6445944.1 hypothetical protein [Bacillus benzoevorans]